MATPRQKLAVKEVLNGTTITLAMKKAKYADTTSKTTGKLTRSKGWEELMEKFLPDKDLAKVHKEGLSATTRKPRIVDRDDEGRPVYEYEEENDYAVRHKYLDTAYKLKKRLTDIGININLVKPLPTDEADKNLKETYGISNLRKSRKSKEDEPRGQIESN